MDRHGGMKPGKAGDEVSHGGSEMVREETNAYAEDETSRAKFHDAGPAAGGAPPGR